MFGWNLFHSMLRPNKGISRHHGSSVDGSDWLMFTDVPWISMLEACPDMEPQFMKPEWVKGIVPTPRLFTSTVAKYSSP